jgi:hypothetical protein
MREAAAEELKDMPHQQPVQLRRNRYSSTRTTKRAIAMATLHQHPMMQVMFRVQRTLLTCAGQ